MKMEGKGSFGTWVANMLIYNGITATELAKEIGVTRVTVSRHINMHRRPHITVIKRYAEFFGVDWFELYDKVLDDYRVNASWV